MPTPGNPAYRLFQGFWAGIDLLFPPRCGGCGVFGLRWCPQCQEKVQVIKPPLCPICGNPHNHSNLCPRCRVTRPSYAALRSWAEFGDPLRLAMHKLKYDRDLGLGEMLSRHLIDLLTGLNWPFDIIVPVPLGVARLKERGYNQADLLARPLAMSMKRTYNPQILKRMRETPSQVGLTYNQRHANVAGAFLADSACVSGCCVLVVDDVTTSGATIDACAEALLEAGARQVYALTLARAIQKSGVPSGPSCRPVS
jgi:competence protein ComFC